MSNVWKNMKCRACGEEEVRASNAIYCTKCSPSLTTGLKHQIALLKSENERLRLQVEHITHHAGQCPFCGALAGHSLTCIGISECPECKDRARNTPVSTEDSRDEGACE